MTLRVLLVFGTRPEGIKMAPLVRELKARRDVEVRVCVTSQHREMLTQVLDLFEIVPDYDLQVMREAQGLTDVTVGVLAGMPRVFAEFRPDWVVVQGDTTTTMATSLAAFYAKIAVGHVEAGLRTGNPRSPWPEEMNRRLTSVVAAAHYAPTEQARANLIRESVPAERVLVTGNTVIDALLHIRNRLATESQLREKAGARLPFLDPERKLIMVTGHRRENFGAGLEAVCMGLLQLAKRADVQIVYPVHLNPNVRKTVLAVLGDRPNIHLIEPLDYLSFVHLMSQTHLIVTDSGGIQEEAPVLGIPVLITRDTTERPEAVTAGTARLIGPSAERIIAEASRLLDDAAAYAAMTTAHSPFGDGTASTTIAAHLLGHAKP